MPTFRQYLKQNKIAYAFRTFEHLKELPDLDVTPARIPPMTLQQIGDGISSVVGSALSTAGMSETAANLTENVNAAVEEVDDIIKGQGKKLDFLDKAAKVQKTADKLRSNPNEERRVQRQLIQHSSHWTGHKNTKTTIRRSKKSESGVVGLTMEHLIASTVEALHEKPPTESWTDGCSTIPKIVGWRDDLELSVEHENHCLCVLIVYLVHAAYTQGFQQLVSGAAATSITEQVVTVANWVWQACRYF